MSQHLSDMAGVLLAGGSGRRMLPLTAHTNKHLIPVHMRPMIEYPLGTLLGFGLREILVITGREHMGRVVEVLGSGQAYGDGVDLTYKVQDEAGGIAHALALAERFVGGRKLAVVLGDNVFDDDDLRGAVDAFAAADADYALNVLAQVPNPESYGVATLEEGRITNIVEKPTSPASQCAVTGLYLYPPDVFTKVTSLAPSARGELEITDVNNMYASEGRLQGYTTTHWFDAGEPGPWMRTQSHVAEHPERFTASRFQLRERTR